MSARSGLRPRERSDLGQLGARGSAWRQLAPRRRSASLPRLALSKYSGQTHHLRGPEATRSPCRIQIVVVDSRTRNAPSKGFLELAADDIGSACALLRTRDFWRPVDLGDAARPQPRSDLHQIRGYAP